MKGGGEMKLRRWICFLLCLVLTVCLCAPALADGELFFVAVNDTIPLTLSVFPTYSGGTLYVPYQVFDSQPCGVTPSYNQAKQTYVLLSRTRQMIFDLAAGTVSDESGSVSTANVLYRGGILYLPLTFCASHFGLKTTMLESAGGYQILRFTDGSEVYDDSLFIEKAENLIAYRISQQSIGTADGQEQPGQTGGNSAAAPDPPQQRLTGHAGAVRRGKKAGNRLPRLHRQRDHARQYGCAGNLQAARNVLPDGGGNSRRPVAGL